MSEEKQSLKAPDSVWGDLRSALSNWDAERVDALLDNWIWEDWHEATTYAKSLNWKPRQVRHQRPRELQIEWVNMSLTDEQKEKGYGFALLHNQVVELTLSQGYETTLIKTWLGLRMDEVPLGDVRGWRHSQTQGFWGIPINNMPHPRSNEHPMFIHDNKDRDKGEYAIFDLDALDAELTHNTGEDT